MRIKADWTTYLHESRKAEFEDMFEEFKPKCLDNALELGSGDDFGSMIWAQCRCTGQMQITLNRSQSRLLN